MKRFVRYSMLTLLTGAMLTASCTGWDEHFNVVDTNSDHIEIYAGDTFAFETGIIIGVLIGDSLLCDFFFLLSFSGIIRFRTGGKH